MAKGRTEKKEVPLGFKELRAIVLDGEETLSAVLRPRDRTKSDLSKRIATEERR
jgi:hypothetical protein